MKYTDIELEEWPDHEKPSTIGIILKRHDGASILSNLKAMLTAATPEIAVGNIGKAMQEDGLDLVQQKPVLDLFYNALLFLDSNKDN